MANTSARTRARRMQALVLAAGLWVLASQGLAADRSALGREAKAPAIGGSGFQPAYKLSGLVERRELSRNQAYARVVWLPEAAATELGSYRLSLGLARLAPVVRRSLGDSDAARGRLMPVLSMPVSRTTSLTLIPNFGGSTRGMVALQLRLD